MTHLAAFLNLACAILLSTETYTRVELSLRFVIGAKGSKS
jgi:hypothetical protein